MSNPILIIEDDFAVRKFVHAALVEAGYGVIRVGKVGTEGLRMASDQHPSLLLLDLGCLTLMVSK